MKMEAAPSYRSRSPPRNLSTDRPWTGHGEVYQTSEAVGLMASPQAAFNFDIIIIG